MKSVLILGSTGMLGYGVLSSIAKYKDIKHGKHLCSIECADEFNKTLENFIDKNYEDS